MNQRCPITGGINFRGLLRSFGIGGLELHLPAARATPALGILQTVPPHPQPAKPVGQIGNQEPSLVVGDDDLAEWHREGLRFRDHPDSGFRLCAAAVQHHAANTVFIDLYSGSARTTRSSALLAGSRPCYHAKYNQKGPQHRARHASHLSPPYLRFTLRILAWVESAHLYPIYITD